MRDRKLTFLKILFMLGISLSFLQGVSAQNEKTVTGLVSDESGIPLPGVTVVIKNSTKGVITDLDGKYSIGVPPNSALLFSFLGMETQEVKTDNRSEYHVQLFPKVNEIDEVTVVAFAKQKKESVISSITTINPKELKVPSRDRKSTRLNSSH